MTAPKGSRLAAWLDAVKRAELRAPVRQVLLEHEEYMDWHTLGGAHPGPALLAARTRYAQRTVKYALAESVELGWLVQTSKGGIIDGKRVASTYRGAFPKKDQLRPVHRPVQEAVHGSEQGKRPKARPTRARDARVPVHEVHTTVGGYHRSTSGRPEGAASGRPARIDPDELRGDKGRPHLVKRALYAHDEARGLNLDLVNSPLADAFDAELGALGFYGPDNYDVDVVDDHNAPAIAALCAEVERWLAGGPRPAWVPDDLDDDDQTGDSA